MREQIRSLGSPTGDPRLLIEAFGAGEEAFPPGAIVQVPIDRSGDSFAGGVKGVPLQFSFRVAGIDRVTAIVSEPIGHEGNQAVRFSQSIENQPNDLQVDHLAVASDVVDLARLSLEEDRDQGGTMVFHVNPVAY